MAKSPAFQGAENQARAIIARMTKGMPAQVVQAVEEAGERVAWQVAPNAFCKPGNISRRVTAVSGQSTSFTVRTGQPFIGALLNGRVTLSSPTDDSALLSLRWQNSALPGYLLGDADEDFNLACLSEVSTPIPQLKPWSLWPLETNTITLSALTLAGTARVVVGLHGIYLHGFGASA